MPRARLQLKTAGVIALAAVCGAVAALVVWKTLSKKPKAATLRNAENFRLLDQHGTAHELHRLADAKAVVLVSHGNGCPIVQRSARALADIRERFGPRGVEFLMLNSNPQDDVDSIAQEAGEYGIDFPILKDPSQAIARSLGIRRTAEALVIDPAGWRVVFHGAIDNRQGYGWQKSAASREYLSDALNALLKGRSIAVSKPPGLGCLIRMESSMTASYARDAAPALLRSCRPCHGSGATPPALTGFDQVKGWAPMIRETLLTRRMPPWGADGRYGRFKGDVSLNDSQLRALIGWIEAGAPRGEGPDPLLGAAAAGKSRDWVPSKPDFTFRLARPQRIAAVGAETTRIVPLQPRVDRDLWVGAVSVRDRNRRVVHHVQLLAVPDPPPQADAFDGGAMKFLGESTESFFVPSGRAYIGAPPGTAVFVPKGSQLLLDLHYVPSGRDELDDPVIGLHRYRGTGAPRRLSRAVISTDRFEIAPGAERHKVTAEHRLKTDRLVFGLSPHMHARGASMRFDAYLPDGSRKTLLSVPDFGIVGQRYYELASPQRLPAGTRLVVSGVFDNSARNGRNPDPTARVKAGPRTQDEMFQGHVMWTAP